METTIDIDDDVLQAAKELAQHEGSTVGRVISTLVRRGLAAQNANPESSRLRNGVPVLPSRGGEIITLAHVQRIMDEEGI